MEYRVGDYVTAIDNSAARTLTVGKTYQVIKAVYVWEHQYLYVENAHGWKSTRFRPATSLEIMACKLGGEK